MDKRQFRNREQASTQAYPTLDTFDASRRSFLARLGAAVLGAGAMAALAGCGGRSVGDDPDAEIPTPGVAPPMDALLDTRTDAGPDGPPIMGAAPMPDAEVDGAPNKKDIDVSPGFAPQMDALIDDGGSCPNP